MEMAPSQNSPKHILNALNYDCITEIFRRLTNADDFLSAAETCTKFQSCATDIFRSMESKYFKNYIIRHENFPIIFGHLMQSAKCFQMRNESFITNNNIFQLVSKYCGKTVKDLVIIFGVPPPNTLNQFTALEKLTFYKSTPQNIELNSPIKCLSLNRINILEPQPWFVKNFPELEHVKLNSIMHMNDNVFNEFVSLNPQLKSLDVMHCSLTMNIVKTLTRCLPNLEHLCFLHLDFFGFYSFMQNNLREFIVDFVKFQNLKSFVWGNYYGLSVETLINACVKSNIQLESLSFYAADEDMANEKVFKLKTLKHLTIHWGISLQRLHMLLKTQTNLETIEFDCDKSFRTWVNHESITAYLKLYISEALSYGNLTQIICCLHNIKIDLKMYESVLASSKNRLNVRLEASSAFYLDVPEEILKANREWLEVKVCSEMPWL